MSVGTAFGTRSSLNSPAARRIAAAGLAFQRKQKEEIAAAATVPEISLPAFIRRREDAAPARTTLAPYILGEGNRLAHGAVSEVLSGHTAAPVLIHGPSGVGKTHLLHWARGIARDRAETTHYAAVGPAGGVRRADRERVEAASLVLIDDVQFMTPATADAVLGPLFFGSARQARLVIAADRPANELPLPVHYQSRLSGGLSFAIRVPDRRQRQDIVSARLDLARIDLPDLRVLPAVEALILDWRWATPRTLTAAINRIVCHFQVTRRPIDIEEATALLEDLAVCAAAAPVTVQKIQRAVARQFEVSVDDMVSARRTRNVLVPRQVAMYLARFLTPRSLPEIGHRFGNRDHTTVLHAISRVDQLIRRDADLAKIVTSLRAELVDG